jgi:hypothetical protein
MAKTACLPFEPLWNLARLRADEGVAVGVDGFTVTRFAEMTKTTTHAATRWRRDGTVPWFSADAAAVALGLHPSLVWGDAWWNVKGDFDKIARKAERALERDVADAVADDGLDV